MEFIAARCTGCRMCEMICSLHHVGACDPSLARILLRAHEFEFSASFTEECDECALCERYCPYGAIERGV